MCAFVYDYGQFIKIFPMENNDQESATDLIAKFCDDIGVPINSKTDQVQEIYEINLLLVQLAQKGEDVPIMPCLKGHIKFILQNPNKGIEKEMVQ